MKGLTENGLKSIENLVKKQFDYISLRLLGIIPQTSHDKNVIFKTSKGNLISLFLQALESRDPNKLEEASLKSMLRLANGYLNALKDKTATKVAGEVNSYVKNKHMKNEPISLKEVRGFIDKEMDKAGNHLKLIANAETNKAVNVGRALQISKISKERKIKDPTVYFVVTIDDVTGPEEFVLHLLPDRKTPRVWKLSEIGSEYHKKGDPNPKLPGLHPNCRCKLVSLPPGFGFTDEGKIKYISQDHDEFKIQREKYGLPR